MLAVSIDRISPLQLIPLMRRAGTLLVGVFPTIAEFKKHELRGAVSLAAFKGVRANLDRQTDIVFYSSDDHEDFALRVAKQTRKHGFAKTWLLESGWDGWQEKSSRRLQNCKRS